MDYFQCGVDAQCTGDQITVQWHEHVFCPGEEVEDIVDYSCTYDCKCNPETFIDWPENGEQMVADYCLEGDKCIASDPENFPCDDADGWFWVFDGEQCVKIDGCVCGGCPGAYSSKEECMQVCDAAPCSIPASYPLVPLGAIVADPEAFDDSLVALEDVLTADANAVCTLAECTPEDPCCNGCAADYTFTGAGQFITVVAGDYSDVGCSGTNCDFMDNCTPFALDQSHLLWGGFQYENGIGTIYLDGFCE